MGRKKKILIVDDDQAIRVRSKAILAKKYTLALAENGKEALEILETFAPDLILLDVDMPVMDGLTTCRQVRLAPKFRFIKIIFVSGNVTLEDRLEAYKAGADDYILKPYDQDELMAKVKVMLRLKNEEEISDLKSDFLALISHETRTPLNSIIGFSELMCTMLPEEHRNMAKMISESGNRLFEFIQKATMLCELKAGQQLYYSERSLRPNLDKIIDSLSPQIEAKKIQFNCTGRYADKLQADWSLLNQAFLYIIENSIKFSPAEGEIEVMSAIGSNNQCVVTITDSGEGITPDWLDDIFDEFAIKDIAHHQKGQGLSLAIARHIIELHQGSIKAGNASKKGAVFTIELALTH